MVASRVCISASTMATADCAPYEYLLVASTFHTFYVAERQRCKIVFCWFGEASSHRPPSHFRPKKIREVSNRRLRAIQIFLFEHTTSLLPNSARTNVRYRSLALAVVNGRLTGSFIRPYRFFFESHVPVPQHMC